MNQTSIHPSGTTPGRTSEPERRSLLRILFVAAILLAVGLATVPLDRGAEVPAGAHGIAAPFAASMPAAIDTGTVPAASEAFAGREEVTEPQAPTF